MKSEKKGIVRPGQTRPFIKPTQEETEERISYVEARLREGPILKSELMRRIKKKFNVEWRAAENYLARARERIVAHLNELRDEHRADSLAFYEGVMQDIFASTDARIRACERRDKLLGLDRPTESVLKLEHSGSLATNTVPIAELGLDIEVRKKLLSALRKKQDAKPV